MLRTHRSGFALLVAAAMVVASCGSDDDSSDATDPPTTTAASTTAASATTEGASSTDAPATTEGTSSTDAPATTEAEPETEEPCTADQMVPEFNMAMNSPPTSLDPTYSTSSGSNQGPVLQALYGSLMRYNVETGAVEPELAESLTPNADFSEWTMNLRPGITFGTGAPLDTEAVKYSIGLFQAPDSKSLNHGKALLIQDMEIISDTEMVFTLTEPWAGFPITLGPPIGYIVDPAVYASLGPEAFAANPKGAGAGPFELESWVQGESVTLVGKQDYWGDAPCIETLVFTPITDARTLVDAFSQGEIDGMHIRGPEVHNYVQEAGLTQEYIGQVVNGGSVMLINGGARGQDRVAKDVRIRQAISLALDPTVICERVYAGNCEPNKALLSADSAFFSDGIESAETNPDKARELLDTVKAETGWDGHLYYPTANTPVGIDTALIVEAQLTAVGFVIERDSTYDNLGIIRKLTENADFDIMTSALSAFDSEIWGQLTARVDDGTTSGGWIGFDMVANPEWPVAMDELKLAESVDDQKAAIVTLSELWNTRVPMVTLDHHRVSVYWQDEFEGFDVTKDGIAMFGNVRLTTS